MIVLGVETSTARSSVALVDDGVVLAHEQHEDPRGHGAFLAPAMRRCLDVVDRVDAVAVGTGPGLYTGLRVGMATAAAFATARGIPVVGVGGMDALASDASRADLTVVTTLDARRGQVFWAVHEPRDGALVRTEGPRVGTRAELDETIDRLGGGTGEGGPLAVGPLVVGEVGAVTVARPDAGATARIGARLVAAGARELLVAAALEPVYLRDADVRIGWDVRGGRRGGAA